MLNFIKPGFVKHITCRNNIYPKSNVVRFSVPDDLIFWTVEFKNYSPICYTDRNINGQIWADQDISEFTPKWNSTDENVNRVSHIGTYNIDESGYPLNPFGRTGIRGRGLLGRWGPNHAADPIVTRWKRSSSSQILQNENTNKNILQMVVIQRHDNKMWAIPGGMVDPGEKISTTLKREFLEEALGNIESKKVIEDFFTTGKEVYKGYVDDFRNTDNAWMETEAFNFHDESGDKVSQFELSAGDDAINVKWIDVNGKLILHGNHSLIVQAVATKLKADW